MEELQEESRSILLDIGGPSKRKFNRHKNSDTIIIQRFKTYIRFPVSKLIW